MKPSFAEEKKLWRKGYRAVACLDEAGRGPLAGPVVAGAVVTNPKIAFPQKFAGRKKLKEIKDSKKLSPEKREELYGVIISYPEITWGVGSVSEKTIDKINILGATKLAMQRALQDLRAKMGIPIDYIVLDGNFKIKEKVIPQKSIIRADNKVFSCAAASIIAKVTRDRMMQKLHKKYPQYGFDRHKGYPTKYHRKMVKKYGISKAHRKSFEPVRILATRLIP